MLLGAVLVVHAEHGRHVAPGADKQLLPAPGMRVGESAHIVHLRAK